MALHEDKDRVMLQMKLLVPPAQSAVDFIDLFCIVNYPGRAVKGSFQQQVTSHLHQLILIICPSHDCGQLLAFSCVAEGALSEKEMDGSTWARGTGGEAALLFVIKSHQLQPTRHLIPFKSKKQPNLIFF